MDLELSLATVDDAAAIAALRTAVAQHLTVQYGKGHWSSAVSEKGVLYNLRTSRVYVARMTGDEETLVATLSFGTKKPWAIDTKYFSPCKKPLYLTNMAVVPDLQRTGIGRRFLGQARRAAEEWPADTIRLDAYDAEAGAGKFYEKCGFREVGRVSYRNVPLIYFETIL
ncbi:MAG TPA: GNAT family N-acetyltransferase [Thermoanaerobaculia bacterium]|nr:GNAT family N-acetyltransferase [Thermoanaerobaculia bacterium]